ncbi:MAG: iron ABC transporter permease [Spirochaetales bacterium]|jgi:iron(III) transport system permease protein|nr:iron ABC transporter permease [Spirochaetales bacterium]
MARSHGKLTWGLIAIVGFLTVCPVLMLLFGSLSEGLTTSGSFTLAKYISAYTDPDLFTVLFNTAVFVPGSALLAVVLALFLSYISVRTDMPFRFLFKIIPVIPMMIPHILFSISWVMLLNPSNGILNLLARQLLSLEESPLSIYSLPGMIMVEGLLDMPIAYLIIAPAMASFDVALEESSRVCGAGSGHTLFRITLPVLRPAILAAFILCVIRCLASFAVPSALGMPGRIYVLATHLYRMISTGFAADYGQAAAVGVSVLVTSVILIYVYRHFTSASEKFVTISGRGYKPTVIELKRAKIPVFVVLAVLSFVLVVLPVLVLVYISLVPYSMVPSSRAFSLMSLKNWSAVIADPVSLLSLKNSLFLGVFGASLGILLSVFVAYVIVKVRTKSAGLLETLSFLSFSFPGIVIGVGFMWFFVRTPLYATIWALLAGYIATYLPYGIRPLSSAFVQIHNHLEESSLVAGASYLTTFRRVIAPLLMPGIVSGWVLMATMFFRELTLSVVLSRPGSEVLAVQILRFSEDGQWGKLSALGIIMIGMSTVLVSLVNFAGAKMRKV